MLELDVDDNKKEYKIEIIWNYTVYIIKLELGQLLSFNYLVA